MLSPRGLLKFHTNLRIRYSIFERKWCWNFPRDFIKSIDHFEYYCSFITVSSSPWTQTTFNLFRSFISFSNVLQVLVHKSLLELVKFTYTYFIPWDIILNVIALFFLDFLMLLNKYTEGSKMVTGTQMQTAWAPWVRDLAETLEPHLVEVKNQGELKLCHSEPLARGRLLNAMIHWENRWATWLAASSEHASENFSSPNRWEPSNTQYPSVTPGMNHHNLPGQTDQSHTKKEKPE
jgi:hypothetical protein